MIIDAKDLILGRMASFAAKKALLGEKIDIINVEESVITGDRKWIIAHNIQKRDRGIPLKGPYMHRSPEKFVKRTIRGMLPYKKTKGRTAFNNIKCYEGIPDEFKDKKAETINHANIDKVPNVKFIKVKELCKLLGGK